MFFGRDDYNRIQDPEGLIPVDEPVFLLRAQDPSSPATIRKWAEENLKNGGDPEASRSALVQAQRMDLWQHKPVDLHEDREKKMHESLGKGSPSVYGTCGFESDSDLD